MDLAIIIIYSFASLLILIYSIAQLALLISYKKAMKAEEHFPILNLQNEQEIPLVTIQLPVYNELYVIERLLKNIGEIEYPKEKLEIQVLDDSTDESVEITCRLVKDLQQKGLDICHIRREERTGFKAGALKQGLKTAKGEFIAIFDADFLPGKDWLLQTVPQFKDPEIGMVQTRWTHINRNFSLLTKMMAFALDFHFILEQKGRNFGKHFINFNGTAGIWRKECILDAGNWSGDTLTEDLDLSYRAQIKNWKFKFLRNVETPAELPVVLSAARSQQFRWNKGAAENFRKNYGILFKNKNQSAATKFHGFFHLLNSSVFFLLLILAVLSVPLLYIQSMNPQFGWYFNLMGIFAISAVIFFLCYWVAWSHIYGTNRKSFISFTGIFLAFFAFAMGLSVHNSRAILEGHFGRKSDFIRTPKFNLKGINDSWKNNIYLGRNFSVTVIIEALLLLYFGFAIYSAFTLQNFGLIIFHLMLFAGFGYVVVKSLGVGR